MHPGYREGMDDLATVLAEAGGSAAPPELAARLRALLAAELDRGGQELHERRSGYGSPLVVGVTAGPDGVRAVVPAPVALRADPDAAPERAWLLVAATVGALVEAGGDPSGLRAGGWNGEHLVLDLPGAADADLAALAFEDQVGPVDRLRARALALPGALLADASDLREPPGTGGRALLVAAEIARLGGRPADPAAAAEHEDAVLAALEAAAGATVARPHEDPDPARRVARRILQRLNGMGKWGGYHTEFSHLARGFAGNDRALADEVGEALLAEGLLLEKPSVGQRHVFLNPRRAGDIHAFIDDGAAPPGLRLPAAP